MQIPKGRSRLAEVTAGDGERGARGVREAGRSAATLRQSRPRKITGKWQVRKAEVPKSRTHKASATSRSASSVPDSKREPSNSRTSSTPHSTRGPSSRSSRATFPLSSQSTSARALRWKARRAEGIDGVKGQRAAEVHGKTHVSARRAGSAASG